jgi:hypothetical protein
MYSTSSSSFLMILREITREGDRNWERNKNNKKKQEL